MNLTGPTLAVAFTFQVHINHPNFIGSAQNRAIDFSKSFKCTSDQRHSLIAAFPNRVFNLF